MKKFDHYLLEKQMHMVSNKSLAQVKACHEAYEYPIPEKPCIPGLRGDSRQELRLAALQLQTIAQALREYLARTNDKPTCVRRIAMGIEELGELADAMAEGDMEHVFKEALDVRFVAEGNLVDLGLAPIAEDGADRLFASNMSKLDDDGKPVRDHAGKTMKGPNYQKCELGDLLK